MSVVIKGEFKGHKMLSFKRNEDDEKFWFGFGIAKAQAVLEHIKELEAFVKEHGETKVKVKQREQG